jgi:hypothetical protein
VSPPNIDTHKESTFKAEGERLSKTCAKFCLLTEMTEQGPRFAESQQRYIQRTQKSGRAQIFPNKSFAASTFPGAPTALTTSIRDKSPETAS